mmetsp:Transcript_2822/g.11527  ORF Transcript_2822/g.11527 Transcript_2822/m.11527 type:complete len:113 (-) Transcript_2822:143-481(-)
MAKMLTSSVVLASLLVGAVAQTSTNIIERRFDPKDYAYVWIASLFFILSGSFLLGAALLRCFCNSQRALARASITKGIKAAKKSQEEIDLVKKTVDDHLSKAETGEIEHKND